MTTRANPATKKLFNMQFKRDKQLTQERYEKGQCFLCGEAGHKARHCPNRDKFVRPKLAFAAFAEHCERDDGDDNLDDLAREVQGSDDDESLSGRED